MPGDGPQPDPLHPGGAPLHAPGEDLSSHAAPAPRFSLPPDLLRALEDLDAGAASPLLDETPLGYGDLLNDETSALAADPPRAVEVPAPPVVQPATETTVSAPLPPLMTQAELDILIAQAERLEAIRRAERDAAIARATADSKPQAFAPLPPPGAGESYGLLTQEELDRALQGGPRKSPRPAPAEAHSEEAAAHALALTQAELDAYLETQTALLAAEAAAPGHHHERPADAPLKAIAPGELDDEQPLTQDMLDALLQEAIAERGDAADHGEFVPSKEGEILRVPAPGASEAAAPPVLDEPHAETATPDRDADAPHLMTQSDLDALIASATIMPARVPLTSGMPPMSDLGEDSEAPERLTQADLDALIAGTPAAEPAASEDAQLMTQADLDALIAGTSAAQPATPGDAQPMTQADLDALIAGAPAAPPATPDDAQLMTQADLDALIAGTSAAPPTASDDAQLMTQADLDALIAGAPAVPPATPDDAQLMTQADLDALIAGTAAASPPASDDANLMTQADLDALIAGTMGETPASSPEVLSQADLDALMAGTVAPPAAAKPVALSQADLDALLAGVPMAAEPSQAKPADDATASQDDIDSLLQAMASEVPDAPSANVPYDQAEIDALINGQAEDAAPLAPDQSFDTVLGNQREDDALTQGGLDSLLVGHDPGEDISVSDEHVDALLAELDRPRAAAVQEDPLSQDLLDAILASAAAAPEAVDVGLENLAAAASTTPPEPTPLSADDLAELIGISLTEPEDAGAVESAVEEPTPVAVPRDPHPVLAFVRRHPLRLASAIAAGFVVGAWTYLMLDAIRIYRPSLEQYVAKQDAPLDVVLAQAQRLIDEGAYGEAITLLDGALARSHPSPERSDAEYLRVEALYKQFSGDPYTPEYDQVHARIDEALSIAPQHPRAAEALLWKARLYALAELPHAEAEVYATIIDNHSDATNFDAILHDAAKLALELDEPLKAVAYTRQLIQNFPGSPLAGGARLLMADAYRRAGTLDDARTLYVRVAQAQPGTPAGAEAHYRLGEMSFEEGNYARAIQDLTAYLNTTTSAAENAKVFLLLAKAYQASGELQQAHERLEELINFFPESDTVAEAYVVLSQVLEDKGQRENAVNVAMQAAARFPNNPEVLQNSGEFLGLTGNPLGAATALVNAHNAGAGNPELLLSAARYFRAAGMPGNARDTYDTLRAAYPRSAQALTGVVESAEVRYSEGQVPEAMAQLEEMLATTKGRPERLDGVRALLRMTQELGIRDRTIALASEAAGLSDEPEVLAESALALFAAEALTEGQEVFNRVDLARVRNKTAFDLLMGLGKGLLQVDPVRGLGHMEEAYLAYPNVRTPQSDLDLLDVYLATGRAAAARRVVMELASHVEAEPIDTPLFLDAASAWGDWLYGRGDYRAAAEAYTMVADNATVDGRPVSGLRSDPSWAKFQHANALFALSNFTESLPIYEEIAASDAPWAPEARMKADHAQLEQRLRGVKTASTTS